MHEDENSLKMIVEGSTAIRSFEYNKLTGLLKIVFCSGHSYDYPGIPEEVIREWMTSESKGKYFHQKIRSR